MVDAPPGPRGELADALNLASWRREGLGLLARIAAEYGDLSLFSIGDVPIYLVNHPTLVRELLVDNFHHLRKPEALKRSNRGHWGDGLTSLDGEAWRERKQLLRPIFQRRAIERWGEIVVECTRAMLTRWRPGMEIRLFEDLVDLRASIAAREVLGASVAAPGEAHGSDDIVPLHEARGGEFVLTPDISTVAFVGMRRPRAAAHVDGMSRLIARRIAEPGTRRDVVSCLARMHDDGGRSLPPREIADETLQMYFAGHLTVPTWLTQLWYVLGVDSDIDARVHRESQAVLGGRLPTTDDLARLGYAACVVQETGRFFAPAPILYREVHTPFVLGGYLLERDFGVWICPQLLHHDPRHFPQPERFVPERFEAGKVPAYAYLPFGAGPRTCIGRAAALMEMQLILATICRSWRLSLPSPPSSLLPMPEVAQLRLRAEVRQK